MAGYGHISSACRLSNLGKLFSLSEPWFSLLGSGEDGIGQNQGWLPGCVPRAATQYPTLRRVPCLV